MARNQGASNAMEITALKSDLITKVQANLEQHRVQFEKALDGWRREVGETLDKARKRLLVGRNDPLYINLQPPKDHSVDYQRTIGMLQMHTGETITLDAEDYARFVDDDWSWKAEWLISNTAYMEKAGR